MEILDFQYQYFDPICGKATNAYMLHVQMRAQNSLHTLT